MPIIGIECVGLVVDGSSEDWPIGTPVAAIMGGLGRTINGSYAEYTSAPASNVIKLADSEEQLLELGISWAEVAAIPETYATAWICLFGKGNLQLKAGQRLLVRGGTSSLGRAAINLAVNAGVIVTATTRNAERLAELTALGAEDVWLEKPDLDVVKAQEKFDGLLNLVGNSVLLSSLTLLRRGGKLCLAGFLGGLAPIPEFNPLLQMASGVYFSFFGSFVFGAPEWPLDEVPLVEIVKDIVMGKVKAEPAAVFHGLAEAYKAHELMEKGVAGGKMVVVIQ